jgi:hypothetical protein
MEISKQLAIFLENKPGKLLLIASELANKHINIEALSISDSVDHAIVRIIVDKTQEATHMLEEMGFLVVESDLLKIPLANAPGLLASLCQKLSDMKTSIEYAYGSSVADSPEVNLYVRVLEPDKILQAFSVQ